MSSISYAIYARKSSEQEDRQVQSIGYQITELDALTKRLRLNVKEVLTESASAKAPGRKLFSQMVEKIKDKEITGIVVWNPDRLSRNSIDAGQLIYLLDLGILKSIVTPYQSFTNTPNDKFMLSILWGQAKLDNDNKGINVKRGLKTKASKGWLPAPAPLGYANVFSKKSGFSILIKDKKVFPILQLMWSEILRGQLPADVWREYSHEGEVICRSAFYKMLTSSFYCGEFEYPVDSGIWYQGKHLPMVTRDEFDQVQKILGDKGKPRRRSHDFTYRGMFKCGECGCMITATKKLKYLHKQGRIKHYTYYHCSKKSRIHACKQPPVTKADVDTQVGEVLNLIRFPQEFLDWAIKWNDYLDSQKLQKIQQDNDQRNQEISEIKQQLERTLKGYVKGLIGESDYINMKHDLEVRLKKLEAGDMAHSSLIKKRTLNDKLIFAREAKNMFIKGDKKIKREVLFDLGSNFSIKDKKVAIQLENIYEICSQKSKWSEFGNGKFELTIYADDFDKRPDLVPTNPSWLGDMDSNHDNLLQREVSCH